MFLLTLCCRHNHAAPGVPVDMQSLPLLLQSSRAALHKAREVKRRVSLWSLTRLDLKNWPAPLNCSRSTAGSAPSRPLPSPSGPQRQFLTNSRSTSGEVPGADGCSPLMSFSLNLEAEDSEWWCGRGARNSAEQIAYGMCRS